MSPSPRELTQAVKQEAYRLGFALVGVTTADSLPHEPVFLYWLEGGRQGEMGYLATERSKQCRAHPDRILPECRSVLVLGVRYPNPWPEQANPGETPSLRGRVASYAWGTDYHEFVPPRLQRLVEFIEGKVGQPIPQRGYTDTGPILERELAQRAGLGWIGKNTCLIHPHLGSYFLLAEILLGIELEPDLPFTADRCGTCTRCLQACPTGCILPDRTLDASRCISYLTIELKGAIPAELRSHMDGWVFGCDVCQQVCPWNRFACSPVDAAYDPLLVPLSPDLLDGLALSAQDFNHKYRHSPLSRARRRGYLRNLAVALGNLGGTEAVALLAQLLQHEPEPRVRAHVAWALGQIGGAAARQALVKAPGMEHDLAVLREIDSSLKRIG